MAQTTTAYSGVNCAVEYSIDGGTVWIDVSGYTSSVVVDGGARQTGNKTTFMGDTPILTTGKRETLTAVITVLDEGIATGLTQEMIDSYEAATPIRFRWSPQGGAMGHFRYTTATNTYITTQPYTSANTEEAGPTLREMTIETESIAMAAIV